MSQLTQVNVCQVSQVGVRVSTSTGHNSQILWVCLCQLPQVAVKVSTSTGCCECVNFHRFVCLCQVPHAGWCAVCQLPRVDVCVHTPAWVLVDAASNSIPNVRAMPFYHSFCLPLSLGPQGQLCSVCEGRGVFWNTNKHQTTNCTI